MSIRPVLFAAAIGLLAACSDTPTGPSESVTQGPKKAPTAQPNSPPHQPITDNPPSVPAQ